MVGTSDAGVALAEGTSDAGVALAEVIAPIPGYIGLVYLDGIIVSSG
jgi:hypothetical protein